MLEERKSLNTQYSISNLGRIRNNKTNKILTLKPNHRGYLKTNISLDGKVKTVFPHRLVAIYFIPNPNNLPQVNHIDGCKTNNVWTNLEWCDAQYNTLHAIRTGLFNAGHNAKACLQLDNNDDIIAEYTSVVEAAKAVEGADSHISDVCNGKRQTAYGYKWKYKN